MSPRLMLLLIIAACIAVTAIVWGSVAAGWVR